MQSLSSSPERVKRSVFTDEPAVCEHCNGLGVIIRNGFKVGVCDCQEGMPMIEHPTPKPFRIVCQYCGCHVEGPEDGIPSHGMCDTHLKLHHREKYLGRTVTVPLVARGTEWSAKTGLLESIVRRSDLLAAAEAILDILEDCDSPALAEHDRVKIEDARADAENARADEDHRQRLWDAR